MNTEHAGPMIAMVHRYRGIVWFPSVVVRFFDPKGRGKKAETGEDTVRPERPAPGRMGRDKTGNEC